MLEFFEYIIRWIVVIPYLVMAASLIAALTPTPKDDGWVKKIYMVLDWIALNVGRAKDK
jgi:hypothetical protein|tara:strand:+ start:11550 stop:11726 length:177 start_codon:yes stop_codon:yes gene_type:complete